MTEDINWQRFQSVEEAYTKGSEWKWIPAIFILFSLSEVNEIWESSDYSHCKVPIELKSLSSLKYNIQT